MSWSRRAILLALLPSLLEGCGFHPLDSERVGAVEEPALASIRVLPIKDRIGQQLELALRETLNPHGVSVEPRYTLSVGLNIVHLDLGILRDANATRARVDVYADVILRDIKTGTAVYNIRTQSTSSFNVVDDGYAAQVAEEDARTRTVRDLTDDIRTRLTLFLQKKQTG